MSLPEAVEAIRTIAKHGFNLSEDAVAGHLGHATVNSGPFRSKVAALRDYGLLSAEGYGVTPLGQDLSLPDPTKDGGEQAALARAFRNADIFAKVYDSLQRGHSYAADGIGNIAVRTHRVRPKSKSEFEKSFVESVLAAGLMERTADGQLRAVGSRREEEVEGDEEADVEMPPGQRPKGRRSVLPVVHHTWQVADGEIVFEVVLHGTMPATAYGQIQKIVEQGDELANMLGLAGADELCGAGG